MMRYSSWIWPFCIKFKNIYSCRHQRAVEAGEHSTSIHAIFRGRSGQNRVARRRLVQLPPAEGHRIPARSESAHGGWKLDAYH